MPSIDDYKPEKASDCLEVAKKLVRAVGYAQGNARAAKPRLQRVRDHLRKQIDHALDSNGAKPEWLTVVVSERDGALGSGEVDVSVHGYPQVRDALDHAHHAAANSHSMLHHDVRRPIVSFIMPATPMSNPSPEMFLSLIDSCLSLVGDAWVAPQIEEVLNKVKTGLINLEDASPDSTNVVVVLGVRRRADNSLEWADPRFCPNDDDAQRHIDQLRGESFRAAAFTAFTRLQQK